MKTVNIDRNNTDFSKLIDEAAGGEDIMLAEYGKPLVRLSPISAPAKPRKLGTMAGQIVEKPGCWDRDMELENSFYESEISQPKATKTLNLPPGFAEMPAILP